MEKQKTIWTQFEDNALKELRINRKMQKWSQISKTLFQQFSIKGKSGKRCRQRFQNTLNQQVKKQNWTLQQQELLIKLHNQKGNKWTQISKILKRSDNSVKNHFHSKLRKAVRRINLKISLYFKCQLKQIKNSIISKIIQTAEQIYKPQAYNSNRYSQGSYCYMLKNQILEQLQGDFRNLNSSQMKDFRDLVMKLNNFNKNFKRKPKKQIISMAQTKYEKIVFQKNSSLIKSLYKYNIKKQNLKENKQTLSNKEEFQENSIIKVHQKSDKDQQIGVKQIDRDIQQGENSGKNINICHQIANEQIQQKQRCSIYQISPFYPYSKPFEFSLQSNQCFGFMFPIFNFCNQNFIFNSHLQNFSYQYYRQFNSQAGLIGQSYGNNQIFNLSNKEEQIPIQLQFQECNINQSNKGFQLYKKQQKRSSNDGQNMIEGQQKLGSRKQQDKNKKQLISKIKHQHSINVLNFQNINN